MLFRQRLQSPHGCRPLNALAALLLGSAADRCAGSDVRASNQATRAVILVQSNEIKLVNTPSLVLGAGDALSRQEMDGRCSFAAIGEVVARENRLAVEDPPHDAVNGAE